MHAGLHAGAEESFLFSLLFRSQLLLSTQIDAFWRNGARPALRPDGGRNLFQFFHYSLLPVSACAGRDCESEQGENEGVHFDASGSDDEGQRHRGVGGESACSAAVLATLRTACSGLTGRVVRSEGVPIPASPKWAGASLPWWGALCPAKGAEPSAA